MGSTSLWVVEVVSWKPNDLNVCTLLSSSQMIFLHSTVGNVTIIKSTHDDGCSELSLHICACVMLLFVFLNKALHSGEMIVFLKTDNQLVPTNLSKNFFPFFLGDFSEVPDEAGGFSSDSGEEGSDKLGACWWRGKTCWQSKLPTVLQLGQCVWQGLLWLSRTHLHLLSFQGEKGKPAGPQIPSALSWWVSATKRVFFFPITFFPGSGVSPLFHSPIKNLVFLYDFDTKMLWDLFFFHCTGRAAVSGLGRSVICSWILAPCGFVGHLLCSLGLCWEAAGWAGIHCPLLYTEGPLKFSSLALKPFL